MTVRLSVVVPTHNPREDYLRAVLDGLRNQSLSQSDWELLVVDNGSEPAVAPRIDLSWHRNAGVAREDALGLTRARLAGFRRTLGGLIVLVDDDNVLARDYLEEALRIAEAFPQLGTWGGSVVPRFERPDLAPPLSLYPLLTLRAVTADLWSNDADHHASTPWGAGLCIRREVFEQYARKLEGRTLGLELDLQGEQLVYGGDTDIAYTGCAMGLGKGVFKALQVEHLIPGARCDEDHLYRVAEGRGYSEVLHHLVRTGRLPEVDRSLAGWLRVQRGARAGTAVEQHAARARLAGRKRALRELGERA